MNLSDTAVSYIRTYTPALAGLIIGGLVSWGLPVPTGAKEGLTAVLSAIFIAGYYALARWAEQTWPWAGWLLGVPKQPVYVKGNPKPKTLLPPVTYKGEHGPQSVTMSGYTPTIPSAMLTGDQVARGSIVSPPWAAGTAVTPPDPAQVPTDLMPPAKEAGQPPQTPPPAA